MLNNEYQYAEITRKIIGCAMKVHAHFGMGFPETVYKRSLLIELDKIGLKNEAEIEKDIFYKGIFIGKRRLDLIVEEKVLIELKAIKEVDKSCHNQILNYLKVFGLDVGLLLNFGTESLQFKRFIYNEKNGR
jgi:GxxExxY protein